MADGNIHDNPIKVHPVTNPLNRAMLADMNFHTKGANPTIINTMLDSFTVSGSDLTKSGRREVGPVSYVIDQQNTVHINYFQAMLDDVTRELGLMPGNFLGLPSKKYIPDVNKNLNAPMGSATHLGVMKSIRLNLGRSERISRTNLDFITKRGFKDAGLSNLIGLLESAGIRTEFRKGELVAKAGTGLDQAVSIPLFSASLGAGSENFKQFGSGSGEFMFKSGSVSSVTAQVAELAEGGGKGPILKNPVDFSKHFYQRLISVIQEQGVGNLKDHVGKILSASPDFFEELVDGVNPSALDAAGYVDPLQYAGRQKLGRHHLGHANQILLMVTDTTLLKLIEQEKEARVNLSTANKGYLAGTSISTLKESSIFAKQALMDHIKRIQGQEGTREAELAKRLNLAWASQSGEWIFGENRDTVNKSRSQANLVMLKMTSENIKNLSILPGQDLFDKQRQFQLSRGLVSIDDVRQLPASVAAIMGYHSDTMTNVRNDMRALNAVEKQVAFGRRAVGVQFLDSRLNTALFGDSGTMMSANLMEQLDVDPISGQSRHQVTSKISLKQINTLDESLDFRGILRSDIAASIMAHRNLMDSTNTIRFTEPLALDAHSKMSARGAGLSMAPDGRVVVGEKTVLPEEVRLQDLQHTNDILRDVRRRGLDPKEVQIIGAKVIQSTGELELIMSPGKREGKNIVIGDSGYIYNSHRVSVGQALDKEATRRLAKRLGISDEIVSSTGIVFGDLGLSPVTKKSEKLSYGFNTTLLGNLAEIISRKESGVSPGERKATKALLQAMGGDVEEIFLKGTKRDATGKRISETGRRIGGTPDKLQFQSLGSKFERISDKGFISEFSALLSDLKKIDGNIVKEFEKETFKEFDIRELMGIGPGFDKELLEKTAQSHSQGDGTAQLLKSLGLSRVQASIRSGADKKFKHMTIVSMGGEIAVRDEEPLAKFGTKANRVTVRQAMFASESFDFARGQVDSDTIMKMRTDLFKDFIDSHPHLFKKDYDYSLMFQMSEGGPFKEGEALKKLRTQFKDKRIGTIARILQDRTAKFSEQPIIGETSVANARQFAKTYDGKLPDEIFKNTILGMITDSAKGIAEISDQALLIQGPNGPMLIPSAKAMGFSKEKGFVRLPGTSGDFNQLETALFQRLKQGQTGTKEAQSMYLSVLEDVEKLERNRRSDSVVEQQVSGIQNKLNRLYKVMAMNSLSKQGLFYNAAVDPEKLAMAGRFRMQTAPSVGLFEVGVTKSSLAKMFEGSTLKDSSKKLPGLDVNVFTSTGRLSDDFIKAVEKGKVFTYAFREPIAGGRQMMALKLKLIDDKNLRGSATNIDFSASAFLHSSMVQYGMEGDFDKDNVTLFRMLSMDDQNMQKIHQGQIDEMQGILDSLSDSQTTLLKDQRSNAKFQNIDDVMAMLSDLRGGDGLRTDKVRDFSMDALLKIVQPKHQTPIIEAYMTGRSYVDHMVSNLIDIQASGEGREVIRQNFLARLGQERADEVDDFLQRAKGLFLADGPGTRGGRFATYNYTDARNLTKYMFLKKATHQYGSSANIADDIMTSLISVGENFRRFGLEEQKEFMDTLAVAGDERHLTAKVMIDQLSEDLLSAAGTFDKDRAIHSSLRNVDPQTASLLHNLVGDRYSAEQKLEHARLLSKRMIFTSVMAETLKGSTKTMPGEGMIKDLSTILPRLGIDDRATINQLDDMGLAAQTLSDLQGMTSDLDYIDTINRESMAQRDEVMQERVASRIQMLRDEAMDAVSSTSSPDAPNSSYRNALVSGEFFAKISQTKYFKPAAAIIGGLAGVEAFRGALDRFSPGVVPSLGYNSANTMPPPPMISSPQDPTFARDAMPNTNVARVAKHHGQRNSVNISGKMDRPVDFRGITNNISLNNGYIPNIQGSFRSSVNDTMSQAEMAQFVGDRMGSSF